MRQEELFYRMALSKVSGIGPVKSKKLIEHFGSAKEAFEISKRKIKTIKGLSEGNISCLSSFKDFSEIEKEILFLEKNNFKAFCYDQPDYPDKLKNCNDAPLILFYSSPQLPPMNRVLSIIGTRSNTDYGRKVCEELIEQLKPFQVCIISGLAFGIDMIAHKACLKNDIPTIGVMASGLDIIYPAEHKQLSNQMKTSGGGLMSEYFSGSIPDKGNFPSRNRIVAGIADATIVIETGARGGSMITAELAYSYNRDVFCFPGRANDLKSKGCNDLIKNLKGQMICSYEDVIKGLGWDAEKKPKKPQRVLFAHIEPHEQELLNIILEKEAQHIDELLVKSKMNISQLAASLLNLEMQNLIQMLPGKRVEAI